MALKVTSQCHLGRKALICLVFLLLLTISSSKWFPFRGIRIPFVKGLKERHRRRKEARELRAAANVQQSLGVGLLNLGNTCYMNAVLQGLYHASPFRRAILDGSFQEDSVGSSLQSIFADMEGHGNFNSTTSSHRQSYVDTSALAWTLSIDSRIQEDAQEFLLKLIHNVDQSIDSEHDKSKVNNNNNQCQGETVVTSQSLLPSSVFSGETEQIIRCISVDFTKRRKQNFLDLSLEVTGFDSLEASLNKMFLEKEVFEGDNQYRAGEWGLQDAEKTIKLAKLPPVLCIHLKRFDFNPDTGTMKKINSQLHFPFSLNVSSYIDCSIESESQNSNINKSGNSTNVHYNLASVVIHEGSLNFGHYTAFARQGNGKWVRFNDKEVTAAQPNDVSEEGLGGRTKSAYILFYEKSSSGL